MPETNTPSLIDTQIAASPAIAEMLARGFKAWNGANPQGTALLVTQNEVAVKVFVPTPGANVISNICVNVSTIGATLTSGQNLLTLYNQAGTLVGQTADQSGVWTTTGTYLTALTTPTNVAGGPGAYCWVGVLSNGTTPATFRAVNTTVVVSTLAGVTSGALTGAALMAGRTGAAVTAPASFTPANLVSTNAPQVWIGLS